MQIEAVQTGVAWGLLQSLGGKTFCPTGKLSVTREDIYVVIRELGGYTANAVGRGTDFLLVPDYSWSSSKVNAANRMGVRIIDEATFCNMIFPLGIELQF